MKKDSDLFISQTVRFWPFSTRQSRRLSARSERQIPSYQEAPMDLIHASR